MKSGANLELEHGKPRRVTSLWSLKVVTETGRNLHDHPQANSAEKQQSPGFQHLLLSTPSYTVLRLNFG
jgi:hypothetical protein